MKLQEIRDLSVSELVARKKELSVELFHLRVKQQGGQLERPSTLRDIRKEVARVETVRSAKENAHKNN